jgi:hypothetical protein
MQRMASVSAFQTPIKLDMVGHADERRKIILIVIDNADEMSFQLPEYL